jgi:hypothetical protein
MSEHKQTSEPKKKMNIIKNQHDAPPRERALGINLVCYEQFGIDKYDDIPVRKMSTTYIICATCGLVDTSGKEPECNKCRI